MRIAAAFIVIALLAAMTSCATVLSGTKQRVRIATDIPGALVFVDGDFKDSTPCVVKIKRTWDPPSAIRVEKPGYRDVNVDLVKKMNELSWLNFINLFGWLIDGATASAIRYQQPDTITLHPRKKTP